MTPPRSTGDYRHDEKRRKNNPPVGMVAYEVKIAEQPPAHYGYDPHLSPQLIWAGKPGLVNIEVEDAAGLAVDTVSLHIHERVSTQAIIHAVQKPQTVQLDLFADPRQPLQQAVEFYQHDVDWANRLILGDSLLVMNSLVQRELHARYLDLRRRKQQEIDRIIAEDAPQETLYDQPQIDSKIVRVAGPFTVEAIPPAELASSDANFLLIELMRQDGVHFPDNRRLRFASLTPLTGSVLHAEGVAEGEGARVAISFRPQHGAVTARQVEDGLWEAVRGGYDLLVFAGFAFDGAALSAIETGHPRLRAVFSHIRPDVLLTDARGESLLKTTASAQLFTVFGEPDIELRQRDDGAYEVELLGVDVYDPLTGEVHSARASQVAAWFLDSDYDRRTFHICQAFFPNKSAWEKLGRALKGTLNDDPFDQLTGRVSLPFQPGDHRRIAVKVIDQRGNEVMRVVGVTA